MNKKTSKKQKGQKSVPKMTKEEKDKILKLAGVIVL